MVDNETGVKAMVDAMERETGRAAVPMVAVGAAGAAAAGAAPHGLPNGLLRSSSGLTRPAIVVAELS